MNTAEANQILVEFLERWPLNVVKEMSLQNYVDVGNPDTFCQWVETKTRKLGSIKGYTSIKFGIYKRKSPNEKPQNYINGEEYSWAKGFGENRSQAFEHVKSELIKIIRYAETGDFEKIDDLSLYNLFKWKVAYLYSNKRLVPIFKKATLKKIARYYGLDSNNNTLISEIQNIMMKNKPSEISVHQFMIELYDRFGNKKNTKTNSSQNRNIHRYGTSSVSTEPQERSVASSYVTNQKHAKLQKKLEALLVNKYGETCVILEENFVDIKVIQPDYINFYEVKSDSYASDCIRNALGQILQYVFRDEDSKPKNIFVVGQYPPNSSDEEFISFVKRNLDFEFNYIHIDLST